MSIEKDFTSPPQCMPEQYKSNDPVRSYRDYYLGEKMYFAKWNYTEEPSWINA